MADESKMENVRLLPVDIRSRLRSGVAISSLSQCAEELILNAVDAKATCIAVRIDTSLCKIQVVDNGHGIDKVQMENVATRLYLTRYFWGSLSGWDLCPGRPPCTVKSGRYASYWNAFLLAFANIIIQRLYMFTFALCEQLLFTLSVHDVSNRRCSDSLDPKMYERSKYHRHVRLC